MKRYLCILGVTLGLALGTTSARAEWGSSCYSGYQPWYNPLGYCNNHCRTPEEKRLQKFWHDYYHALKCYYGSLEHLDWVGYYKNHGQQINGPGCGGGMSGCAPSGGYGAMPGCAAPSGCGTLPGSNLGPINYAPVFVSPTMQWAIPNCGNSGPTCPGS